jgi:hypothetical protein
VRGSRGRVRTLPEAPGADPAMGGTQPTSINDRGRVVGLAYDAEGGSRGFQLRRGNLTPIDASADAVFTRPVDINDRGQIVGDYGTRPPAGARVSNPGEGFEPSLPGPKPGVTSQLHHPGA